MLLPALPRVNSFLGLELLDHRQFRQRGIRVVGVAAQGNQLDELRRGRPREFHGLEVGASIKGPFRNLFVPVLSVGADVIGIVLDPAVALAETETPGIVVGASFPAAWRDRVAGRCRVPAIEPWRAIGANKLWTVSGTPATS